MLKVSIITACYNSKETIRDTLESIASQTHPNIEYIVIDGGSTDGTLNILNEYSDTIDILESGPDNGIYDAMNKGIERSSGEVVGILNSDDILGNSKTIATIVESFDKDVDATYGDLSYFKTEEPKKVTRFYSSSGFSPWKIRFGLTLPHPTFYARKRCYEKLGLYKMGYRVSADFELIARFAKSGLQLKRIPQTLVRMRQGGISTTGFWWRIHQNLEIVRACKENGIYTNLLFVSFKLPFKLLSIFKRS